MQTRKCHAAADTNANANRIRTKKNMSPSPLVGDIILSFANNSIMFSVLYFRINSLGVSSLLLISEQFSAGSKSQHIINKKLSMEVFFPQLVSDQRLEGSQMVENKTAPNYLHSGCCTCCFLPSLRKVCFNLGGIRCVRACRKLQYTYSVR